MFAKFRLFKPARLVFDGPSGAPGAASEAPPVVPVVAPVVQPAPVAPVAPVPAGAAPGASAPVAPEAVPVAPTPAPVPTPERVQVQQAGVLERLKARVTAGLDDLQKTLDADYGKVADVLKLSEKAVLVNVPANLDFLSKDNVDIVAASLRKNWEGKDFTQVVAVLKAKVEKDASETDLRDILSSIYASAILKKAKAEFGTQYPLFDAASNPQAVANFEEFNKANPPGFKFSVNVEFDPQSKIISKAGVVVPTGAAAAYEVFQTKKGPAPTTETNAEAAEAEAKHDARVKAFSKTFLARVLGFFGLLPMKDGANGKKEVDYDAVLNGSDPIAVFAIGLCGGKQLLDDPKGYDDMVASIPDKQRALVESITKGAEDSALSLKKAVESLSEQGVIAGGPAPEPFDNEKFNDWMAGQDKAGKKVEMPKQGFKLANSFTFNKGNKMEGLDIDLSAGGQIVVPEGSTFNIKVDGNKQDLSTIKGKGDKVITAKEFPKFSIVGTMPKNVIFRGNIKGTPEYRKEKPAQV